jgi:ABC-type sugar transport system permease subunit
MDVEFHTADGRGLLLSAWFTNLRLKIKAVGMWRAIFYLPNLIIPAVVAALFNSLFAYYGPVNQFMVRAGFLEEAMHFLQNAQISPVGSWSSFNGGCGSGRPSLS